MAEAAPARARVLVVDDEPSIRRSMRRVLEPTHDVVEAEGGREALAMLHAAPDAYDLVLCDLEMPEIGGAQVWAEIGERHPEILQRVVFVTGGARTSALHAFIEQRRPAVLDKPFEVHALRELADRLIRELRERRG